MADVPHNYIVGAFTNGAVAGEHAATYTLENDLATYDPAEVAAEQHRALAPARRDAGIPPNQIEYKTRRLVNDCLQPPKVTRKYQLAQDRFAEIRNDLETARFARDPHELMRSLEVSSILDCADMAAHASLFRTESRWGPCHHRVDFPERDDENWFCHTILSKVDWRMVSAKRAVEPYIVPIADTERDAYDRQRIHQPA